MKKNILYILLFVLLQNMFYNVFAVNNLKEINIKNKEILNLKVKNENVKNKINLIKNEINNIYSKAEKMIEEQLYLDKQCEQIKDEIIKLNIRIKKRFNILNNQLRNIQINNNKFDCINYILNSKSIFDLFNRIKIMSIILNANNEILKLQKNDKKELEKKQIYINSKIKKIIENKIFLERQKGNLEKLELELNIEQNNLLLKSNILEQQRSSLLNEQKNNVGKLQKLSYLTSPNLNSNSTNIIKKSNFISSSVVNNNKVSNINLSSNFANQIVNETIKHIGKPYVWGAKGPNFFDCSGLVNYVFNKVTGVNIGSWSVPQEKAGYIINISEAKAGDLYFWGMFGLTHHVAIAIGGGKFIHAPKPGSKVEYGNIFNFKPSFAIRILK